MVKWRRNEEGVGHWWATSPPWLPGGSDNPRLPWPVYPCFATSVQKKHLFSTARQKQFRRVYDSSCLKVQSAAEEKSWRKSLGPLAALWPQQGNRGGWMLALRSFLLPVLIQFLTPARGRVLSTFRVVWKCFYSNSQASCLLGLLSHFKVTINIYLH